MGHLPYVTYFLSDILLELTFYLLFLFVPNLITFRVAQSVEGETNILWGAGSVPASSLFRNLQFWANVKAIKFYKTVIIIRVKNPVNLVFQAVPSHLKNAYLYYYIKPLCSRGTHSSTSWSHSSRALFFVPTVIFICPLLLSFSPGICVAQSLTILRDDPDSRVEQLVADLLKNERARVVVMFVNEDNSKRVLKALLKINKTSELTFLASDSWGAKIHPVKGQESAAEGAVTLLPKRHVIKGEYTNMH